MIAVKVFTDWDPIAIYGAALSTVLAIRSWYENRACFKVDVMPEVELPGSVLLAEGISKDKTYIGITIANYGHRSTTLTHIALMTFKNTLSYWCYRVSLLQKWFRPDDKQVVVFLGEYELDAGGKPYSNLGEKTQTMLNFLTQGKVFVLYVSHTASKTSFLKKINLKSPQLKQKSTENENKSRER